MSQIIDNIAGCIYGQHIGDALGTRYEFLKSNKAKKKISNDIKNNFLPILGGGPFNLTTGMVTDDTEIAMGLMQSILDKGLYDKNYTAKKYIKWYHSNPFDIGNTTRNAFDNANDYNDVIKNSLEYNDSSLSNGCLMRVSPLAVYGVKISDKLLLKYCEEDTIMTNPNKITIDAVKVFCVAIKTAILTNDKKQIFDKAYTTAQTYLLKQILKDSLTKPDPIRTYDNQLIKSDSVFMGYCGIAIQNAFYELLNGKSFYDSLVNIISRGGDTDTNACIAGSLLGAYYGKNNIPLEWIKSIKIYNPRSEYYPEINQLKIDEKINHMINIINN